MLLEQGHPDLMVRWRCCWLELGFFPDSGSSLVLSPLTTAPRAFHTIYFSSALKTLLSTNDSSNNLRKREEFARLDNCIAGLRELETDSPVRMCGFFVFIPSYLLGVSFILSDQLFPSHVCWPLQAPSPAWPPSRLWASIWKVLMTLPGLGALLWLVTWEPRRRETLASRALW